MILGLLLIILVVAFVGTIFWRWFDGVGVTLEESAIETVDDVLLPAIFVAETVIAETSNLLNAMDSNPLVEPLDEIDDDLIDIVDSVDTDDDSDNDI